MLSFLNENMPSSRKAFPKLLDELYFKLWYISDNELLLMVASSDEVENLFLFANSLKLLCQFPTNFDRQHNNFTLELSGGKNYVTKQARRTDE